MTRDRHKRKNAAITLGYGTGIDDRCEFYNPTTHTAPIEIDTHTRTHPHAFHK
jgi:hypothetical protein